MTENELFDELDFDGDGRLTREEIHHAARHFGWQWQQASLFAFLDYMTIRAPLERDTFISCMAMITQDPDGPYGEVLRQGPLLSRLQDCGDPADPAGKEAAGAPGDPASNALHTATGGIGKIIARLEMEEAAGD